MSSRRLMARAAASVRPELYLGSAAMFGLKGSADKVGLRVVSHSFSGLCGGFPAFSVAAEWERTPPTTGASI